MPAADYEVVIGLEVHCQLRTASKMFSACGYRVGAEPNHYTDAYTLGLPGTLPVPNRQAVDFALRLALAAGCTIEPTSRWARKHYFYPDLPKGYQITQSDHPYATGGAIEIPDPAGEGPLASKPIALQRIHLEEDAGKNTHLPGEALSLIDYNRAGAPLVEIVSKPELRSASDAAAYMRELRTLVRYLGISAANMQEGTLRCDANVSLRRPGARELGTRCEIKNLNSFKFLEAAIHAEVRRQADLLDRGAALVSATLSYDPQRDETKVMRSKEVAADYRYFPEPDLPPLHIGAEWVAAARAQLPVLPWARRRALGGLGLSDYDVGVLTAERELADYFDACLSALAGDAATGPTQAKLVCNWITGELLKLLNAAGLDIAACPVTPAQLAELLALLAADTISGRAAKQVLAQLFAADAGEALSPAQIVEREGLGQVSDRGAIVELVREVAAAHPDQLAQLRAGKTKLRGFFVGQVMKRSQGKANPQLVQAALAELLAEGD